MSKSKIANENRDEIRELFDSIHKGLKLCSTKELSGAIQGAIKQRLYEEHKNLDEINFILDSICQYYGIARHTLQTSKGRGQIQQAKKIAYCLLYFKLGMTIRYISKNIFDTKVHSSVGHAIRYFQKLNPKIKDEREFKEKYEVLQAKYIEYINKKGK